jgi:hypothetical protein
MNDEHEMNGAGARNDEGAGDTPSSIHHSSFLIPHSRLESFDSANLRRLEFDKIKEICPAGWFWYIDEGRFVWLKSKPTTPTHTFVFGKHFTSVKVERSIEKLRNVFILWNGETGGAQIYKSYIDQASIDQYRRRVELVNDWSVGDVTTADKMAAKFLAERKDPDIKVICEIADNNEDPLNGYDIESIQPGDTCNFKGFNDDVSNIFMENMLISKVVYSLGKVELTIEVQKVGVVEWQKETEKKINEANSADAPKIYTV